MNPKNTTVKTVHTASHWGAYEVDVENERIVKIRPFAKDSSPSPLINSLADVAYADNRIVQPMVRAGWLKARKGSDKSQRGVEPFVAVPWNEAIDLVAGTNPG